MFAGAKPCSFACASASELVAYRCAHDLTDSMKRCHITLANQSMQILCSAILGAFLFPVLLRFMDTLLYGLCSV